MSMVEMVILWSNFVVKSRVNHFDYNWGGANPKHAGICHLGMGKNGEKWGKMGQIKNFENHV